MLNSDEAPDRIAVIPNKEERNVAVLLRNMGLDFVGSNVVLEDYPEPAKGEVDLIFGVADTMILVEVGAGRHKISKKKMDFFSKWKDESNIKALKKQCDIQYQNTVRVYFDLRSEPENPGLAEVEDIAGPGSMNKIYYKDDYDDLVDRVKGKRLHKNNFLAEWGSAIFRDADH